MKVSLFFASVHFSRGSTMKAKGRYVFFLMLLGLTGGDNIQTGKRNTLLIIADDGGFEMRTYLNKICQTPHLDKLAKQSLIFHNAFTSVSSCSPSRSALLTGIPSHQNGMYGLHQAENHFNSFDNVKSLPNILRENNIRTGIIGKKHVGPNEAYKFDYEQTEENNSILQVGRNITHIKLLAREFLNNSTEPFFLYVAFHDPHRCGHTNPEYGEFCQHFGNGDVGMGKIPDWQPIYYQWDQVDLPYFVPDTEAARRDVSAQYTTISRLDQGVGLLLEELKNSGHADDTLIIYSSDNGIPFPNGRTNLYDAGIREPMFISSPDHKQRRNQVTYSLSSLLDIVPTVLDWYGIKNTSEDYDLETNEIATEKNPYTGRSLLPLLVEEPKNYSSEAIFASHNLHEVTMYYPMRAVRTSRYKLIHNINYKASFPIDQDFYISPTFQEISLMNYIFFIMCTQKDILNRTRSKQPLYWIKTLDTYYNRPEWELYDLRKDSAELNNLAEDASFKDIFDDLKKRLFDWQVNTKDPWVCAPHAVLENKGDYKENPQCLGLDN